MTYTYYMDELQIGLDNSTITFIKKIKKEQNNNIDEFENQWINALQQEKQNSPKDDEAWMEAERWRI